MNPCDPHHRDQDRPSLWTRFANALFGYDFFISYAWEEEVVYPEALNKTLEGLGFVCFLDREDFGAGDNWRSIGTLALRHTSRLILICTPAALQSPAVRDELETYRKKKSSRIISIDFNKTLEAAIESQHPLSNYIKPEELRIDESNDRLNSGPTEATVKEILRSFDIERQRAKRERRLKIFVGVLILLLMLACGAATGAWLLYLKADREWRVTNAQRLSAEAASASTDFPERSLLLAVEALRAATSTGDLRAITQARNSLRRSLSNYGGEPFLQKIQGYVALQSSDGRWILAHDEQSHSKWLWNLKDPSTKNDGTPVSAQDYGYTKFEFTPDSRWLVSFPEARWDHSNRTPVLSVWNLEKNVPVEAIHLEIPDRSGDLTLVGMHLAIPCGASVAVADLSQKESVLTKIPLVGFDEPVTHAVFSPDLRWLFARPKEKPWRICQQTSSGKGAVWRAIQQAPLLDDEPLIHSESGRAIVRRQRQTFIWDLRGEQPWKNAAHINASGDIATSEDHRWLVVSSARALQAWDLAANGAPISRELLENPGPIGEKRFTTDNQNVIVEIAKIPWLWNLPRATSRPDETASRPKELPREILSTDRLSVFRDWMVSGAQAGYARDIRAWSLNESGPNMIKSLDLRGADDSAVALARTSPNSQWVATLNFGPHAREPSQRYFEKTVRLWDLSRGDYAPASFALLHEEIVSEFFFSSDNRYLFTKSGGMLRRWNLSGPSRARFPLKVSGEPLAFTASGGLLARGYPFTLFYPLMDVAHQDSPTELDGQLGQVSPDGRYAVILNKEAASARLWDTVTASYTTEPFPVAPIGEHSHFEWWKEVCLFSPDSSKLLIPSDNGHRATLLDLKTKRTLALIIPEGHDEKGFIKTIFSPNDQWLIRYEQKTGRGCLWRTVDGKGPFSLHYPVNEPRTTDFRFSPDGHFLTAYGSGDGAMKLWNLDQCDIDVCGLTLKGHEQSIGRVLFTPASSPRRLIISDSFNENLVLVRSLAQPESSEKIMHPTSPSERISSWSLSPDGRWLVTRAPWRASAYLWDLHQSPARPTDLAVSDQPDYELTEALFSPDSRSLLVFYGDSPKSVRWWRLADEGRWKSAPVPPERLSKGLVFSPDSRWLAGYGSDGLASLADCALSEPVFFPISDEVYEVQKQSEITFSPDSRWLLLSGCVYPVFAADLETMARATLSRNLKKSEWRLYFPAEQPRKTFESLPAPSE